MGQLESPLWEAFDSPSEILSQLHQTPFDSLKICDNHQGEPVVLMPQIREFSTNVKVSENTFQRGEGAHETVLQAGLWGNRRSLGWLDSQPCSAAGLYMWSPPEAHLRFHLDLQLRRHLGKSFKKIQWHFSEQCFGLKDCWSNELLL